MTKKQKRDLFRILLAGVFFALAFLLPLDGGWRAIPFAVPYLTVGFPVLKSAFLSLIRGQWMNETFLMTVASLGAFVLGEFAEGVAVMLFSAVGELFESYAVGKSRRSVTELMSLCPDKASVLRENQWVDLAPEEVEIGDVFRVLPGEKIPLDGKICSGESSLDTRSLTGETLPRDVSEGDGVLSGCVNLTGVLQIRAEKIFEESTASRILAMVEDATANRAKSETFVATFARWYTPVVLAIALGLGLIPPLFWGGWSTWIYRALEFLVVSCPCALVISVPLSYFGGIGGASRFGVLVKGSDRLEVLAKTDTVVFDKTGTLTQGTFRVTEVLGKDPSLVLQIAALCEQFSNHPIAKSLREACKLPLSEDRVTDLSEESGFGVSAKVDGIPCMVGKGDWIRSRGILIPDEFSPAGTCVFVARGDEWLGTICLGDRVRENAAQSLRELRKLGVRRLEMLTGDGDSVAKSVAQTLALDGYRAELLPADKVEALRTLSREKKGTVVFVGDGMNDAPVLVSADVGIAMGGVGSDAAMEAADAVLMHDDLSALPRILRLARKTHRIVLQNLIFSIAVKIGVMVLISFGFANMWYAVFADVGVSVLAILNAMRTLSKKI
ncbi:MAG: cadmium-translocating P-type ATPase [Clostridia bacterium]|nr:cadmium-translocating P-type ATPase [Clostridia bacterium]